MPSLVINHNLMAMNAARNLSDIYSRLSTSTQRLSSGLRINSAADDAAGLAIRELMRADIAVLNQGVRNASDGISMIQTAEGAMSVIDEKLIRMKELAEQASTGTYTTAQREIMNSEYQAMAAEIDRIANATDFNGVKLLDGSLGYSHEGSGMKIHFGTGNSSDEDYYFLKIADMRATYESGLQVGNHDLADTLRTRVLNAFSPDDALNVGNTTATDGLLALRYSTDFDIENTASATWDIYGYVNIDASQDSINSVVSEINKGRQAQGSMVFATVNTTSTAAQSVTINGNVFTFSTDGAETYDAGTKTGVIGLDTDATIGTASTVAWEVAGFINAHTTIGVFAVVDGATLHLVARDFGETGNAIDTASGTTHFSATQQYLAHGGESWVTASAYYDASNSEYELQVEMSQGGEVYQLQVFTLTTQSGASSIVGGTISGVTLNGWGDILPTGDGASSVYADFNLMNETDEWAQPQNGSGRTSWDGKDILTQSGAQAALAQLDSAITKKDTARANLGAIQNRLENTITNLQIQAENLQAAESRISDIDVATEMTEFTSNNILAQAATAMLAQANSLPTLALTLLGA